jgi:hypothetical protein
LVKVSGDWKTRHRRFEKDYLVSDPTKPVNLADPDVAPLVRKDLRRNKCFTAVVDWAR